MGVELSMLFLLCGPPLTSPSAHSSLFPPPPSPPHDSDRPTWFIHLRGTSIKKERENKKGGKENKWSQLWKWWLDSRWNHRESVTRSSSFRSSMVSSDLVGNNRWCVHDFVSPLRAQIRKRRIGFQRLLHWVRVKSWLASWNVDESALHDFLHNRYQKNQRGNKTKQTRKRGKWAVNDTISSRDAVVYFLFINWAVMFQKCYELNNNSKKK